MGDNTRLNTGSGGDLIVDREISHGGDTAKLAGGFLMGISGTEGAYVTGAIDGDATNGLDVDVTRVSGTVTVGDGGSTLSIDDGGSTVSIDDGGGSLTVDGTVAISGTVTVNASGNAVPVTDNGGNLSVDDGGGSLTVDGTVSLTDISNGDYETVAASQTDQALGATGATGDYLAGVLIVPATTSPGAVSIKDGGGSAITIFTGGASSVTNLVPFMVPLGIKSLAGAWKITTGSSVSAIGVGNFT